MQLGICTNLSKILDVRVQSRQEQRKNSETVVNRFICILKFKFISTIIFTPPEYNFGWNEFPILFWEVLWKAGDTQEWKD